MTDRFEININEDNGEVDVILGHNKNILNNYKRNNVKLFGGWYYRKIGEKREFLLKVIKDYNIKKMNIIGASKSCSGCIILSKEIRKNAPKVQLNLFMFSAYTTLDRNVYIKRNIEDKAPGSLKSFWLSDNYTPEIIKRMEARHLANLKNVNMYLVYPSLCKYGEKALAQRVTGDNVKHVEMPVYLHNTLYPLWKKVGDNMEIEIYENEFRKMHRQDYAFYSKMQKHESYKFNLYSFLENPNEFIDALSIFKTSYKENSK